MASAAAIFFAGCRAVAAGAKRIARAFRMDDISHEFFPEGEDMTGVSFHTCGAAEPEDYEIELRYEE